MPYYCTVPRCTSMAGKAKNVSFHQFPRDEELASLWNDILKRGKPYTKYSKVCSLHFTPEDYTITSVGKNKGQWRTLRKDAVPSRNLPTDSPTPQHRSRSSGSWCSPAMPSLMDPIIQQQMAQAIYMQTMMAMQVAGASEGNCSDAQPAEGLIPNTSAPSMSEIEQLILKHKQLTSLRDSQSTGTMFSDKSKHTDTFKCEECSKCFKDPDVFVLHQRGHKKKDGLTDNGHEKENFDSNSQDSFRQSTLMSNPILANLLKPDLADATANNTNNIETIENQVIAALTANMEAYIKNFTSLLVQQNGKENSDSDSENGLSIDESRSDMGENGRIVENDGNTAEEEDGEGKCTVEIESKVEIRDSKVETDSNMVETDCNVVESDCNSSNVVEFKNDDNQGPPDCDIQDLTITKDSNSLALTV